MRALRKNLPQVTKFDVRTLRKDSNCIAIQDPSAVWGIQDFLPRRNLLTYSEDFSNAAWGKIDITVTANNTTDPFGGSAADLLTEGSAGTAACQQSISAGSGTKFIATVYIKPKENITWIRLILSDNGATNRIKLWANLSTGAIGTANADSGGSLVSATVDTASNGFYVLTLKGSISATSVYFYIQSATANEATTRASGASYWVFGAQLTRADTIDQSYQKISDWVTEQYAWAAARQVPWLRRNRFVATEDLSSGSYTKTGLLAFGSGSIANAIKAPDGTLTADLIVEDTSTGQHRAYQSFSNTNTTVTLSIYAKPKERTWLALRITSYSPADRYQWFNLSGSGVIGTTQSELSNPTITAIADGWYRCSVTLVNTSNTTCVVQVNLANADNVSSYTGDGSSGLYVWGMQAEHSSSATTYQPILASWDATYTANAIAAGYPISLWHDSAGTIAAWESGRAIGAVRDQKYEGYGPDLITNGGFADGTGWSASMFTGGSSDISFTGGFLTVVRASYYAAAGQAFSFVSGKCYLFTVQSSRSSGTGNSYFAIRTTNTDGGTVRLGTTLSNEALRTYNSIVYVCSNTETAYIQLGIATNSGTHTFDNISIREIPGYTAIQDSTNSDQPLWYLDANGKGFFSRDLTNDSLPITLPTVLSDAQLGPELVSNGTFDSDTTGWTAYGAGTTWAVDSGRAKGTYSSASGSLYQTVATAIGKSYAAFVDVVTGAGSGGIYVSNTNNPTAYYAVSSVSANTTTKASLVFTATATTTYIHLYAGNTAGNISIYDNISVREVTGTNVVYTAEGNVSLKDSGLILSGSYAPIAPAADYGRIIMAGESKYDSKILKYLDGKRGRGPYVLGPELALPINASYWTVQGSGAIVNGTLTATAESSGTFGYQTTNFLTAGKVYLITYIVSGKTAGTNVMCRFTTVDGVDLRTTNGVYMEVRTGTQTGTCAFKSTTGFTGAISNVSIREVIL